MLLRALTFVPARCSAGVGCKQGSCCRDPLPLSVFVPKLRSLSFGVEVSRVATL
jgi:hypothetical protein